VDVVEAWFARRWLRRSHAPALGQVPEQETVDGAEGKFAASGARPRTRNVIKNPGKFRCREIRIEKQASAGTNQRLGSFLLKRSHAAAVRRSCKRWRINWRTVRAVPDDGCFRWLAMPIAQLAHLILR